MLKLASTKMQVHTRQTVYGSTSFPKLPGVYVDYGGYIRTVFSVVFLFGIFFCLTTQSVSAEQQEDILENFELTSGPITTDSGSMYRFTADCYNQGTQTQLGTYCRVDVRGSGKEYLIFESIFRANGSVYVRLSDFALVDQFQFSGHSGAFFSLVRPAFPKLKKQWLDLGDGLFLDKREQEHMRTHVLGEFASCIQLKVEQCFFTESTQLMIRSILVGRTVTLLGSDEHMKQKLHALDFYLEKGIPMKYDQEKVLVQVTNEIVLSLSPKNTKKNSPVYSVPAHTMPIGESLDRALSFLY